MARTINPQAVAAKWQQNLARSGDAIKAGVQGVSVAPGQKAAAAASKYADGVAAAVASGKFQRKVAATSLSDWQQSMINKGIPRLNSGAAAGLPKMTKYLVAAAPVYADISATCEGMPNNNLDEAGAKVRVAMEKMRALGNSIS